MYSKSAGRGGYHNWAHKVNNVAALSNILVKLWQGRGFRSIVKSTALHHAYWYAQVQSPRLVYVGQPNKKHKLLTPERMRNGTLLFGVWEMVSAGLPQIAKVVVELLQRKRGSNIDGYDGTQVVLLVTLGTLYIAIEKRLVLR